MSSPSSGQASAHVGCSGWSYPHWRGTFYPPGLKPRDWYKHYAGIFRTVEVNNTFYRLPAPETFKTWAGQAPPGFVYALKVSSFGTHRLKLASPERWLKTYVERAVLLGPALGPNLVQLPPHWRRDTARLSAFLDAAAAMAPPAFRWVIELRDPSWLDDSTYQVLSDHQAALCWHDLLPDHPWTRTTAWAYARFHGPRGRLRNTPETTGRGAWPGRLAGWRPRSARAAKYTPTSTTTREARPPEMPWCSLVY